MADSFVQSCRNKIVDAESRIYTLTTQRNRIVASDEWSKACAAMFFGQTAKYDAMTAKLDEFDVQIAKAEHDRAVWYALINTRATEGHRA